MKKKIKNPHLLNQQLDVPKESLPSVPLRHLGVADPLAGVPVHRDLGKVLQGQAEGHSDGRRRRSGRRSGAVFRRDRPRRRREQRRPRRRRRDDGRGLGVVLRWHTAETGVVVGDAARGDVSEAEGEADGVEALFLNESFFFLVFFRRARRGVSLPLFFSLAEKKNEKNFYLLTIIAALAVAHPASWATASAPVVKFPGGCILDGKKGEEKQREREKMMMRESFFFSRKRRFSAAKKRQKNYLISSAPVASRFVFHPNQLILRGEEEWKKREGGRTTSE